MDRPETSITRGPIDNKHINAHSKHTRPSQETPENTCPHAIDSTYDNHTDISWGPLYKGGQGLEQDQEDKQKFGKKGRLTTYIQKDTDTNPKHSPIQR